MHVILGKQILAKAEMLNVGGSVKDRVALEVVRGAMAEGSLMPGGLITEGTAGESSTQAPHCMQQLARGNEGYNIVTWTGCVGLRSIAVAGVFSSSSAHNSPYVSPALKGTGRQHRNEPVLVTEG